MTPTITKPRRVETVTLAVVLAATLIPVAGTLVAATSVDFSQGPYGGGATTRWLREGWTALAPTLWTSVKVAVLVLVLDVVLILPLVWWFTRAAGRVSRSVMRVVNVPLAVPGIALGLALISSYPDLRREGILLVAGHVLFTMPFVVAALVPVVGKPGII